MSVRKKTEVIHIRVIPQKKQEILDYCFKHNINITDALEIGFDLLKKSDYFNEYEIIQEKEK